MRAQDTYSFLLQKEQTLPDILRTMEHWMIEIQTQIAMLQDKLENHLVAQEGSA